MSSDDIDFDESDLPDEGEVELPSGIDRIVGGGVSIPTTLSEYINRDKVLLGRVDFLGLIGDIGKAAFYGILSIFTAFVVSTQTALGNVAEEIDMAIRSFVMELFGSPAVWMEGAVAAASREVSMFGLFALPVGIVIALATGGGMALVVRLFWGGS